MTKYSKYPALLTGAASVLALSAGMAPTWAQDSVFMEEITVTAQKREQNLQSVGIAITALSGDQLDALGFTNAQEVTALAPGVATLQPNGEANYAIGMRGVANNDFTTNVESPIAIYVDEVYISQMSGAGFYCLILSALNCCAGLKARCSAATQRVGWCNMSQENRVRNLRAMAASPMVALIG